MLQHIETVINALNRRHVDFLPQGELFLGSDFLEHYFSVPRGYYCKQLQKAAEYLGLSLVGIDLNSEWSQSLLNSGSYKELEEYFTVGYIDGLIAVLIDRHGFNNAMLSIKKTPALLEDVAQDLLKDLKGIAASAKASGFNAICLADDIAGNRGLFFPLDYFSDVLCPIYGKIAEIIKENSLFAFFHSDGDMLKVIELLIQARYDCIHPVDAQAGMNLYTLIETFGERVCFMGHMDIIAWTKERIVEEIRLAEERFPKGGLILGSTCGISLKTFRRKALPLYPHLKWDDPNA